MQLTEKGRIKADAAAKEFGVKSVTDRLATCRQADWRGSFGASLRRSCGVTLTEDERRALMAVFGNVSKGLRAVANTQEFTLRDIVELHRVMKLL
jgi:hypothetical protein